MFSKRKFEQPMTAAVSDYAIKTREPIKCVVHCVAEPDAHKISTATFEKMRKQGQDEVCTECGSKLDAQLTLKCQYLDANCYVDTVEYLPREQVEVLIDTSSAVARLNQYKYGLLKL